MYPKQYPYDLMVLNMKKSIGTPICESYCGIKLQAYLLLQ